MPEIELVISRQCLELSREAWICGADEQNEPNSGDARVPKEGGSSIATSPKTIARCRRPAAMPVVANWCRKDAMRTEIPIPTGRLEEFCRRWKIVELRVFGSALREDFRPDSDLDLLVRFAPEADPSLSRGSRRRRPSCNRQENPSNAKHPPHPYSAGADGEGPGANWRANSVIDPVRAPPTPTEPESLTPIPIYAV